MPRKGMRSLFFTSKTASYSLSPRSSPARASSATARRSMIDETIETAETMIMKWNPEGSAYASVTSLFYEDKREGMQFLKCVADLQKAMQVLVMNDSMDQRLVMAQKLMMIAMKRLQKEFYQILSTNRAYLDPESVSARSSLASTRSSTSDFDDVAAEDDVQGAGENIVQVEEVSAGAMSDLRAIAESMVSAGYTKECLSIYKVIRKSIIDESIYRLGVEKISSSHSNRMDWDTMDMKIKNWLEAVKVSMSTLFHGERILCDHVFAAFDPIRESCFSEISREGALLLFGFPELVLKSKRPSSSPPDKIFRLLDMYSAISENWMEIESIFASESTSTVRSQALTSLVKLSESIRSRLADFEASILKDSYKKPVSGAGIHPLTSFAMDYLTYLGDYSTLLSDIILDWPPPDKSPMPHSFFDSTSLMNDTSLTTTAPTLSLRIASLILGLLGKLDGEAKHYKDLWLSYLFLANNLKHVIYKVRTSNLQYILGEEWISKHEAKMRQFAASYERLAWGPLFDSLPDTILSAHQVRETFRKFNSNFVEVYKRQKACIIPDPKLRDEIKLSISRKLLPVYRDFYNKQRPLVESDRSVSVVVRYAPEDVGNYLSDLFFETFDVQSGTSSPSSSSPSSSSHGRRSRFST